MWISEVKRSGVPVAPNLYYVLFPTKKWNNFGKVLKCPKNDNFENEKNDEMFTFFPISLE